MMTYCLSAGFAETSTSTIMSSLKALGSTTAMSPVRGEGVKILKCVPTRTSYPYDDTPKEPAPPASPPARTARSSRGPEFVDPKAHPHTTSKQPRGRSLRNPRTRKPDQLNLKQSNLNPNNDSERRDHRRWHRTSERVEHDLSGFPSPANTSTIERVRNQSIPLQIVPASPSNPKVLWIACRFVANTHGKAICGL